MSIVGRNFHHMVEVGPALLPQTVNNATVDGPAIAEPWRKGREVAFLLMSAAMPATTSLLALIQGQQRSDGAWVTLKEGDGVADLQFEPTALDDAGALETKGVLLGTVPVSRINSTTYKAIRLRLTNEVATAAIVSAAYVIFNAQEHVTGQIDYLFAKAQKGS